MKDIKDYEGLYAITEDGRVWSYRSNKYLKPEIMKLGYVRFALSKGGKTKKFLAHRLVAEAYIPNPNSYTEVSHLDETRDNNCVDNLEWSTHMENCNMPLFKERISESLYRYYGAKDNE